MAQDDLEFIKAVRALDEASKRLNAGADKLFDGQKLTDKVFDKFGLGQAREFQKKTSEFLSQRKLRREQEREVRQRLGGKDPISKATFKQLKKEAALTKKKEAVDAAFKSFVETNLGLNEQLLNQLRFIQDVKKDSAGNLRDRKGKFSSFDAPEKFLKKTIDESEFNRQFVDKMGLNKQDLISGGIAGAKSPGDKNRAAEEERTRDQQAFEMEKTESTNDILRDILAALTGSGIEKKEEGSGGGLLAGLLGLGALKKALAGVASALGLGSAASALGGKGGKGGKPKMGKGLLGKLGGLAAMLGPGAPLILGLGGAGLALYGLGLRADEFTKKVEEDSKKLTEAIKKAETPEEIKAVVDESVKQNQTAGQGANRIRSAEEESRQRQADSERGRATENMMEKKKVIEGSQDINELIRNASVLFAARRDAAIEEGTTIEERYAFFDKAIAETVDKVQASEAFLGADDKSRAFMIQQVVQAANQAIAGNRGKSALLYGLGPEGLKGAARIDAKRTRAIAALQYGAQGEMAEQGFGYFSDLLGGGYNTFSARRVASLQARVAEAQKDAEEETWYERNIGSNEGDIKRLENLTKELERLRDTIAASDRRAIPSIIAPNNSTTSVTNSSASVTHPIHMTDQNTSSEALYP
jgi:hypothetical protein